MADNWQPVERVQKNDAGEFRALVGGEWVPASAAQKNDAGEYRAIISKSAPSTLDVVRNAMYSGAAAIPDSLLNTPNNILNLLKAGGGSAYVAAGGDPSKAPQTTANPDYIKNLLESLGVIKEGVVPEGFGQKAADVLLRGATAGALTGGGGLANTLGGAGMGALSAGSAAGTEAVTGSPTAGMIAGLVTPAAAARVPAISENSARSLMQSAMKPSIRSLQNGDASRAITTALDDGINVTQGGADKLQRGISDQNRLVEKLIGESKATVDPSLAVDAMRGTYRRFSNQATPQGDLKALDTVLKEFQSNPALQGPSTIPVQLAQELKRGTQRAVSDRYGEESTAAVEGQKAIARGLRQEISNAVPEVAPANAREASLINAHELIQRRAHIQGNRNPLGLTTLAHSPVATAIGLADRSELVKSLLARALHSGPGAVNITPQARKAAVISLQNEMADSQSKKNASLAAALRQGN
jgi:hypothetical protein